MHPTIDLLAAFIEQPEAVEFADTRKHIATCGQCRQQVQGLSNMIDTLKQENVSARSDNEMTDVEDSDMEAFIERAKRGQDQADLKAALHYAAHSAAMRDHLRGTVRASSWKSATRQWWRSLFTLRTPLWWTMPVTAAATLALAVMILPALGIHEHGIQEHKGPLIAAYQDDAELRVERVTDTPPGLGFFRGATETTAPFGGMQIAYAPISGLVLAWQPVAGAREYTLNLAQVAAEGLRQLAEQQSSQPTVRIEHVNLETGRRYQWRLSGTMADGARFHISGGFVLANNE